VQQDCANLIKERSGGHEVSSLHDNRWQDDGEEQHGVEVDYFVTV